MQCGQGGALHDAEPEMAQAPEEKGRDLSVQSGREGPAALGQGDAKLRAEADVQLGEHLAQMPLDRAGADEQLRPDLGV